MLRCDLGPRDTEAEHLARIARVRRRASGRTVGRRRRMGHVDLPRRHSARQHARRRPAGPAGLPHQPGRARRLGELRGADRRPASMRAPRTRLTGGSSGCPTAAHPEPCTRAPWRSSTDCFPKTSEDRMLEALLLGQQYLHSSGSPAGRTRSSARATATPAIRRPRTCARARGLLTARVVGALWWDRGRGLDQSRRWSRSARARTVDRSGRRASRSCRTGSPRLHRRDAGPYLDRYGHPTDNAGISFLDPDTLKVVAAGWTRRLPAPLARPRRSGGPRGSGRPEFARAATDQRHRHHIAHLQVVHPQDVRGSGGSVPPRTCSSVGRARAADGRPDPAVPHRGAGRLAVPVRRSAPRRREPSGHGQ